MSEERVSEALRALRRADWNVQTGEGAEVRALLAFRRQRRGKRVYRMTSISGIAAALIALLVAVRQPVPKPVPVIVKAIPAPPAPARPAPLQTVVQKRRQPREVFTPFYPLMPSAPPLESGLLVRVTVEASALRSVGIPVSDDHLSDPVLADVLVGQDDLARAIRFVSYQ